MVWTRLRVSLLTPLLLLAALACGGGDAASQPAATNQQTAPAPDALRRGVEARVLPHMSPELAALVKEQPWFAELSEPGVKLVEAIQRCERAAKLRGAAAGLPVMLSLAAEQSWYADGLDEREAKALAATFDAYNESLSDDRAPAIGPELSSTLRFAMFDVLNLKETGEVVVLVSSKDQELGEAALRMTRDALPAVEQVVGAFPYKFLHVRVTPELDEYTLGRSYDQFIVVGIDWVEPYVVVHEVTHSAMYGLFPIWFEEGLAHFVEHYVTGSLEAGALEYARDLRSVGKDSRLDLRIKRTYNVLDYMAERAQGFLFVKAVYDVVGIEGLSTAIRKLRTRTFSDQELLRAIVQYGPEAEQGRLNRLLCERVIGATRDYCSAAQ